jgi:tetratricopeptide (TPR) repeat protein
MVYSQLGKYPEGAAADREAIKRSPRTLAGYQNLFVGELHSKRPQSALQVLDEAARQSNVDADFLIGLSELYVTFGLQVPAQKEAAHAKALTVLQRAARLHPGNPQLRIKLADGLNLMGDSAAAAQVYSDLLQDLPNSPVIRERIRAKLAELYLQNSDHVRAAEQLEAMLREDPTNPQVYYYLGSIAYEDKKFADAAENFSKTLVLNPDFEQAYYDLASVQINLDHISDALATLNKAREKFGQNSPKFVLEYLTGVAFGRQKAYPEAVAHYTAAEVIAAANEPKRLDGLFYFQVGAACERKGDIAQAEKYFDKCLALKPDFAEALNYSGYMWAEKGIKLEQARQRIEKAVKLEPKNGAYLDSLGWVLFKLNQPQAALDYLIKAASLLPEPDATVYDHLGDVYAALHQLEQARDAWRKSLKIEPSEEVRRKLEAPPAE